MSVKTAVFFIIGYFLGGMAFGIIIGANSPGIFCH